MKSVGAVRMWDDIVELIEHVRRPIDGQQNLLFARVLFEDIVDETRFGVRAIEIISVGDYIIDEDITAFGTW